MTTFDTAFMWMITHEVGWDIVCGGYTNDPDDPGGETRFGISKRFHPDVDIANLTIDEAKAIYKKEYWDRMGLDPLADVSPRMATKVFDTGVNVGQFKASRYLQTALNLCEPDTHSWLLEDGLIGPKTIAKLVKIGEDVALEKYAKVQYGYYVSLDKPKYIKGWTKRAFDIPGEA